LRYATGFFDLLFLFFHNIGFSLSFFE